MRILHICPVNENGHLPIFIKHQLKSLSSHNLQSKVIGFRGDALKLKHPLKTLIQISQLRSSIKEFKPQIIHAHWGSILGFLVYILKPKNSKMILTIRGSDLNYTLSESSIRNFIRTYLSRFVIKKSNFVIFVSKQLHIKSKIKSLKFAIIPDGTPLHIFYPRDKKYSRIKLKWSNKKKYIVFYSGGRSIDKNQDLAMQVIDILNTKFSNIEIKVIQGALSQTRLAYVFSAADALLFTSLNEGSPNIVREALACGCPVVSVRVGDVEKWVKLGKVGGIVNYDSKLLASMLEKVLMSNSRVNCKVAEKFSVKTSTDLILKIYQSV